MYPQLDHITEMLQRHHQGTALIDANLLLLLFVGNFKPEQIPRFKRTKEFIQEDCYTLKQLLEHFKTIITTPNILTEVSNLSGHIAKGLREDYFRVFAQGIQSLDERYCASQTLAEMHEILWLGLTDAGIVHLAQTHPLIITDDLVLHNYLARQGFDVLNFNNIRPLNW